MEEENSQGQPIPKGERRGLLGLFLRKQKHDPESNLNPGSSGREQSQAVPAASASSRSPESSYGKLSEEQKKLFEEEAKDIEGKLRRVFSKELDRKAIVDENDKLVTQVTYINAEAPEEERNNRIMIEYRGPRGEVQRREFIDKEVHPQHFDKILADATSRKDNLTT